jgi:uncharacterized protein
MALVYFDASAFVKLVVDEVGSDLAASLWDGADAIVSSRLAYPEVRAALAAAGRDRRLAPAELRRAARLWERLWEEVRSVEITSDVSRHAGELAARRALRGADAVHLACAVALGRGDTVVAVWDQRLHTGARREGLAVAPATLE